MKIKSRKDEGVLILSLEGKLTIGEGDVLLRDELRDALEHGEKKILLDLGGVKTMDSSGLGELVRSKASAQNAEATIKLLHVQDKVQQVLEMTRLIGVFEDYNDEIDAIASFRD